jgi:LysR family glycine cleavage system transcriptional activator
MRIRIKVNILYRAKEILYSLAMAVTTHLRALQAVELAIRKGSLKAAAAELAITPAALGQRIKALEDYLGLDLLVRGRSGIRATPELEGAVAHLRAGFRELDTVSRILDFQRVYEVHITADSDWADLWLKPRVDRFRKDNPNTLFCINGVGDVPVRLGQADCEIWFGPKRGDVEEDLLFRDYMLPVSSPENTKRIANRPREEALEGFPLLHLDCYTFDAGAIGWQDWISQYGYRKTAPGRGIRYQKVMQALEAVYAHAGFLLCGLALVKEQIDDGRLSHSFSIEHGAWSKYAYRASFRENALRRTNIVQFRDWLLAEALETQEELRRLAGDL